MSPADSTAGRSPGGRRQPPTAAMYDIDGFAALLGCSSRHIRRLVDAGKCPPPVRLGALLRWPKPVADAWIADGCPSCRRRQGGAR
jgi:predicted DNA-binding transcriptional regulator AlpA